MRPVDLRLKKVWRWTVRLVIGLHLAVVLTDRADELRWIVFLGLLVESWLVLKAAWNQIAFYRDFRRARRSGDSIKNALVAAFNQTLPRVVALVVILEVRNIYALSLLARGRKDVPAGAKAMTYHHQSYAFVIGILILSMLEIPVVALLLPWPLVRLIALIIGLVSLWWIAGFAASMAAFPHTIDAKRLRLRFGSLTDVAIPTPLIQSAGVQSGEGVARNQSVEGVLTVRAGGGSLPNVLVDLRGAYEVPPLAFSKRETEPRVVQKIRFSCDDAAQAVREIQALLVPEPDA